MRVGAASMRVAVAAEMSVRIEGAGESAEVLVDARAVPILLRAVAPAADAEVSGLSAKAEPGSLPVAMEAGREAGQAACRDREAQPVAGLWP
jgi:hypothetical protein